MTLTKDRRCSHSRLFFYGKNNNLKRISVLEYTYSFRPHLSNLRPVVCKFDMLVRQYHIKHNMIYFNPRTDKKSAH